MWGARVKSVLLCREIADAPPPEEFFGALSGRRGAFVIDGGPAEEPSGLSLHPIARWCFFGTDPFLVLSSRGKRVQIERWPEEPGGMSPRLVQVSRANPWRALASLLNELGFSGEGAPPRSIEEPPFTSGAVGFFGYDLKHHLERLPEPTRGTQETDDLFLGFHAAVGAYDRLRRRLWLIARGIDGGGENAAHRALDQLTERVERAIAAPRAGRGFAGAVAEKGSDAAAWGSGTRTSERLRHDAGSSEPFGDWWRPNLDPHDYKQAVGRVKDFIAAGDIYQANLSQRFVTEATGYGWEIHRALRNACPAPYAAFLRCGDLEILSVSPEMFLRRRGERVETRPIKGTRPRGSTWEEDRGLGRELLDSAKDRAELVMIIDLERNDLGRVCRTGSVEASELPRLESYANVHHLVATIQGRVKRGIGAVELLEATFPGGSITGAPKIRAMEILDRIEPARRGPYTGAVGMIDVSGDLDLQVAIRTAYRQGGRAWFQVGAGIVADSDPQSEYEETLTKGRIMARVLDPRTRFGKLGEPVAALMAPATPFSSK